MTVSEAGRPDTSDMIAVHQVFRSSFAAAPALIASSRGDEARRALIANYYDNVLAFLEVHHGGEELLVFSLLADRVPVAQDLLARMTDQHHDAMARLQATKGVTATWAASGDDAAVAAAESLAALGADLAIHLDEEEAEILPLAAAHLSAEEWGALPGHGMAAFSGDKVWLILGLIRENFTDSQRRAMLEHMPPPARAMWENMGEAAFGQLVGQVRQTG
jgi:hypothetical protein